MEDLLKQLRSQHAEMLASLTEAVGKAEKHPEDCSAIIADLNRFKKIFVDHVYVENKKLYPQVFHNEKATKLGLLSVKIFLDDLEKAQQRIFNFLKRYDSAAKLQRDFSSFKHDLSAMTQLLGARIRLEEEVVFVLL